MDYTPLSSPKRITEHNWPEGTRPVVSICSITYNHKKYIAQALDGFLIQETTFPVEILIHDDASTDGTADFIRDYQKRHPKLIQAVLQTENQFSKGRSPGAIIRSLAKGEFIAICEGDDYWTDPHKLRVQVEFLDRHKDFAMCFHRVRFVSGEQCHAFFEEPPPDRRQHRTLESLLNASSIATCSVMFRRALLPPEMTVCRTLRIGDYPLWILLARHGMAGYIDRLMADHRFHSGGIWSALDAEQRFLGEAEMFAWITPHLPAALQSVAAASKRKRMMLVRRAQHLQYLSHVRRFKSWPRQLLALTRVFLTDPRMLVCRPVLSAAARIVLQRPPPATADPWFQGNSTA